MGYLAQSVLGELCNPMLLTILLCRQLLRAPPKPVILMPV